MSIIKSSDLYYRDDARNSDKEYHLQIRKSGSVYDVTFQYGRRGSTLNTGTKGRFDSLADADRVYNKVLSEKLGKGYQAHNDSLGIDPVNFSSDAYVPVPVAEHVTVDVVVRGVPETERKPSRKIMWLEDSQDGSAPAPVLVPQLLNPIDESEVAAYLSDSAFGSQEKKDGKHIILRFEGGKLSAYNKKGKEVGYPKCWADSFSDDCILDGEAIGDIYHAFDCLRVMEHDLRQSGYEVRYKRLMELSFGGSIKVVPLAVGDKAKRAMYDKLRSENKEGVVFKKLGAFYKPGKAHSDMCKFKFYATASVRVRSGRVGKHSIGMEVLDKDKWIDVGNCTVPQKTPLPGPGSVAEIRFLYAYPGGALYQPTFLGLRDDVDPEECVITQLKYKSLEN